MFNSIVGNWKTTLAGVISGLTSYLLLSGDTKFPQTKADWGAFLFGLVQIVWGSVMKDATTGSKAV
jgi:hypothetical protein